MKLEKSCQWEASVSLELAVLMRREAECLAHARLWQDFLVSLFRLVPVVPYVGSALVPASHPQA